MPKNSNFVVKSSKMNTAMERFCQRFHLHDNTVEFRSEAQKLKLHTKQIVPCESTAEEVSFEW